VIYVAENGYVAARIYTSRGEIPVEGAVVTVIKNDTDVPTLLGKRTTDRNGSIAPVTVPAPELSLSERPSDIRPFSVVDLRVDHPMYYTVFIRDAQVFPRQTTVINTELIPLSENELYDNKAEEFKVTPQNL
jgi:hypothetical protein